MTGGKQEVRASVAPLPGGGYSQAIKAGEFVFVSGQAAIDAGTGEVQGATIEEQTELTLANVAAVLAASGLGMTEVVKATVHIRDISLFERFDAAYRNTMPEPFPVRTTVESGLAADLLVEIDVVAYAGSS